MSTPPQKSRGIPVIELLFEWVIPIIGGVLTLHVLHHFGFRSRWAFLWALPGTLIFQWSIAFSLMGLDALTRRWRSRNKGR